MNSKMLESKPTLEKINTLVFKTQMTPSDNGGIVPKESARSHIKQKPLITGEDLVILEDENENNQDDENQHFHQNPNHNHQ
jgi:tRNA A37 threonylcarbamoyltransferase TsaD